MKHVISFYASVHLIIADDEARLCWQWPVYIWQQVNLPERAYLAALDGLRWVGGWLPRRDDWRAAWQAIQGDFRLAWMAMVTGGEYWQLVAG